MMAKSLAQSTKFKKKEFPFSEMGKTMGSTCKRKIKVDFRTCYIQRPINHSSTKSADCQIEK